MARHCSPVPAITSVMDLRRHLASSTQHKDNTLKYVHQTSWGMTTRMIGAIIMVHGDDNGLVLPPRIAPVQVMIVPIQQKKEGVLDKAYELKDRLINSGFHVKVDDSDKSPGWKFSDCEMRGIPLRVEIGPKDIGAEPGCFSTP